MNYFTMGKSQSANDSAEIRASSCPFPPYTPLEEASVIFSGAITTDEGHAVTHCHAIGDNATDNISRSKLSPTQCQNQFLNTYQNSPRSGCTNVCHGEHAQNYDSKASSAAHRGLLYSEMEYEASTSAIETNSFAAHFEPLNQRYQFPPPPGLSDSPSVPVAQLDFSKSFQPPINTTNTTNAITDPINAGRSDSGSPDSDISAPLSEPATVLEHSAHHIDYCFPTRKRNSANMSPISRSVPQFTVPGCNISKNRYTAEENLFILKAREATRKIPWRIISEIVAKWNSAGGQRNGRNMQVHYSQNVNPRVSQIDRLDKSELEYFDHMLKYRLGVMYSGVIDELRKVDANATQLQRSMITEFTRAWLAAVRKRLELSLKEAMLLKLNKPRQKPRSKRGRML